MEGKGTPKNEQNQFCHSPSVKAMTPSEVEGQDSHAAGVKYSSGVNSLAVDGTKRLKACLPSAG